MGTTHYIDWGVPPKPFTPDTVLLWSASCMNTPGPWAWPTGPNALQAGDLVIWAWEGNAEVTVPGWTRLHSLNLDGGPNAGAGSSNYGLLYHMWTAADVLSNPPFPPTTFSYQNDVMAAYRGCSGMVKRSTSPVVVSTAQTTTIVPGIVKAANCRQLIMMQASYDIAALPNLAVPVGFTELARARGGAGYFSLRLSAMDPSAYTDNTPIVSGAQASIVGCTSVLFELLAST
ncbi:hypothetical protein [Neorhizobium galegae]|uniref:hypothetical protein n=1 Tax=Neorhizobium galegae TaxID=399 RepID=UPI0006229119|nr:hypothetical protein [Neorhizobium galegae]KAB1126303.1 hypothetical protein F4V90_04090 [Neorhizobium galegae]MCQ1805275.1 hypothetical protein [Neorhizobium galegae]CDZ56036.1 Hypothetical protein NGAL_HAMBI2566_05860 [Neorhizobium galegae bv. orientalis]